MSSVAKLVASKFCNDSTCGEMGDGHKKKKKIIVSETGADASRYTSISFTSIRANIRLKQRVSFQIKKIKKKKIIGINLN